MSSVQAYYYLLMEVKSVSKPDTTDTCSVQAVQLLGAELDGWFLYRWMRNLCEPKIASKTCICIQNDKRKLLRERPENIKAPDELKMCF